MGRTASEGEREIEEELAMKGKTGRKIKDLIEIDEPTLMLFLSATHRKVHKRHCTGASRADVHAHKL